MFSQLINVGLRATTLGFRLVFVVVLARFLPVNDYVIFGITYAFIAFTVSVTSLNFYTYSIRSVLKQEVEIKFAIYNHLGIIIAVVLFVSFVSYFLFKASSVEYAKYFKYLVFIYALEQLSHELYHFLIAAQRQLAAGVSFFIRVGLWPAILCVWMFLNPTARHLDALFLFWSIGAAVSVLIAAVCVVNCKHYKDSNQHNPNFSLPWIKAGLLIAAPLILSTLLVRGVLSFDRVWLLSASNQKMAGAYVLIITVANALIAFLEAGLFSYVYPKLIKLRSSLKLLEFRRQIYILYLSSAVVMLIFFSIFLVVIPYLLEWSGKQEYMSYLWIKYYVVFFISCFSLGMAAQYGLYALELDGKILISHIVGFLIFFGGWLLMPHFNGGEVLITLCLSFFVVGVMKSYYLHRHMYKINSFEGEGL